MIGCVKGCIDRVCREGGLILCVIVRNVIVQGTSSCKGRHCAVRTYPNIEAATAPVRDNTTPGTRQKGGVREWGKRVG